MITETELKQFSPHTRDGMIPIVTKWFNEYCNKYEVNTPLRMAAFFAQVIHECDSFNTTQEYASGSAYEDRKDLGNIIKGDGKKFKGRGYLQVTGRSNYQVVSRYIFGDNRLTDTPELLAAPQYAMLSAFWYWETHKLNDYADKAWLQTITKRVNGGLNGWEQRLINYNRISDILRLPHWKP